MADTHPWTWPERRTNLRLRALIDAHRIDLREAREAVAYLQGRVSELSVELEGLRREQNTGRLTLVRMRTSNF